MGGDRYLTELVESVPNEANAVYYAEIVREKSIGRQILEASTETIREIYGNQHHARQLLILAEERIFQIADRDAVGETIGAERLVDDTMERLEQRRRRELVGLPTGFHALDATTGGFLPGQFVILAARPSQGKTALALNIATNVASSGQGVLFISLEMSRLELGDRALSARAMVPGDVLRNPWLFSEPQWKSLLNACGEIAKLPLWIDDTSVRTVSQIQANARRAKHRANLSLVVIDYLSLIDTQKAKGESRQEEVARLSRRLKAMARDLKVPVFCLHQLNRQVEHRDDRRPRMADLRESGQIEQDADFVLLLHRPEQYDPNDQPGTAELIVAKNRNGATGIVRLAFAKECMRFDSLASAGTASDDPNAPPY